MERLTKIAFYVGIGIAVSVFALFLISFLPFVIGNAGNEWERLGDAGRSDGEILAKFQEHPAYVAMYERFPGAVEKVAYHEDGGGSMEVGAMNFENNSQLVLQTHINDLFAESFIRNTDCLDTVPSGKTSVEPPGSTVCRASGQTITCSAPP